MRLARRLADAVRSPSRLTAFVARVAHLIVRGELRGIVARLRPRGYTPAEYRAWRAAAPAPSGEPVPFLLLLDAADPAAVEAMRSRIGAFAARARATLTRLPEGGWVAAPGTQPKSLADWVTSERVQWLWWVTQPTRFAPGADVIIGEACRIPSARLVYADHDRADASGRPSRGVFKSAFDELQARETNLAGPWLAVHASLADRIATQTDPAAGPWRLLVDGAASLSASAIVHVPRVCAHVDVEPEGQDLATLRSAVLPAIAQAADRAGASIDGDPGRLPWLRYRIAPRTVAVVVPTRDRPQLLDRCLRSVIAHRGVHDVALVVVDNASTDERVKRVIDNAAARVALTIVPVGDPFNFARLCNRGVAAASADVVVLLNNDTETEQGWLDELVALAVQPAHGAVGPLLVYPDGRVQSAGILVGVNRTATSALEGFDPGDSVARDWCATRRRVSAVLGACLAVERRKYLAVGGMDERLAVSHNEVDLCLRLDAAGWASVFTPFARVVHREGATRGFEVTDEERRRLQAEEALFVERWQPRTRGCDPAYHPAFAMAGSAFALGDPAAPCAPRAGWTMRVAGPDGAHAGNG